MKRVIILSGGLDSTTALAYYIDTQNKKDITTITFNYGSKHNTQENNAAKKIANYYGVKNTIINLDFINKLFKSNLLKKGGKIPFGHYADKTMKKTVVPFRNGIMLSIASGYCESIGFDSIVLGNHSGDHFIYLDCRTSFSKPMSEAIFQGTDRHIIVERPFEMMTKTDIVKLGSKLKVPYELTYSCYNGEKIHCGKCGTCYERKEAFRDASVKDPTIYQQ
jgi:7-cyano-7-deazaguanine synthase